MGSDLAPCASVGCVVSIANSVQVAAVYFQVDLCRWLLGLGLDADRRDILGG